MQPTILGDFVDDLSRSREPGGVRGEARRPGLARPRGRAGALARSILRPSAGEPKAGCASRRPPESLRPAPCEPPAPGQNRPAGLPVALARAVAPARHAAAAFLVVFAALLAVSTTAQAQTTGICGRTAAVRTAILGKISGVSNCADVTDAHLAAITSTLRLGNKGITALAAGDFDGLTALTELELHSNELSTLPAGVFEELTALTLLYLDSNSLTTLPAGVFDELTALTYLGLNGNSLTTLPAGVFDELTALTLLYLDSNSLTTLPAGVFDELTALTGLDLYGNPGAPFSPTADALPDDGTVLDAGGDVTLDGSGSDGGPWGTNVTYSWAASGATVTFDDAASATPVVTIPALAAGTELTFTLTVTGRATNTFRGTAPDTDTATVTAVFDATAGICGRTEQVRDAIVALISGVTHCALVTDAHLAAITNTLNLNTKGITALAAGDFDELTALTRLLMGYNSLTTLPAGVFDKLTALEALSLNNNSLTTLPAGVFDKLTALTEMLDLFGNSLSTLPVGVFDELTALTQLSLYDNSLTTLPAGVFDELTALTRLYLYDNSLTTLPDDVFEELTALTNLWLYGNPGAPFSPTAVAVPDDGTVLDAGGDVTLDGSGSGGPWGTNVTYSWAASGATVTFDDAASATPVVTIPALAAGTELTFTLTVTGRATNTFRGTAPDTDTATVTAVFDATAGICGRTEQVRDAIVALISGVTHCALVTDAHLAAITDQLNLNGKGITALAAGDFDGLTALTRLLMGYNSLTTLPAGVFDKLTALEALSLNNNSLTTLPAGVFDELTALRVLYLNDNSLTTLPAGVFDELTALRVLYLNDNSLTTLPDDVFEELTALTLLWLYGNSGAPFSPTADALPDDGTVLDAGGDVTLDGSGSDGGPWGTNVTYSWAASGAAVTFDDAASATPVVTIPALAAGTELTFTLTVTGRATDTFRGTAPDTDNATVTATATNAAPAFTSSATFSAAENQTAAGTVAASDRSKFSIGAASGVLTFRSAPNFEDATDDDASNTYVVVVRATSGTGARAKTEDQTITVTVTDVDDEAPGVPAAPTVSSASVSSLTAAWAAPANAGPPITDYDYRYRVKSTPGWTEVTNTTSTALSATITGLAEDTEYEVQVRATNDEGTSGWSDPGSASTDANAAPAFTSSATFSAAENQTAAGTVAASDSDAGDSVTGYEIQGGADRSKFSIGAASGVLTFRSAPNFEDATDDDASNTYVVVVRATSGTGAREKTEDQTITVTVTDVDDEAPGVPAAPTVSSASVSSLTAAWAAPANAGPPITDYDYRYRVKSTPGWTEVTNTTSTALSATITGLAEDTEYEVQVRATNDEGTSGWSDPGSASTDANAAPAFTSSATFSAAENQTAAGTVAASDSDAGDSVTGYEIQGGADRSKFSIGAASGVLTFRSAPNFEDATDDDASNTYVVVVRATSGTGARAKTEDQTITVTVTDVDDEAPGVPAAPTVSSASVSSLTAAWAAPANAGPPITDYDYRYRVKSTPGWTEVTNTTITALSATITGLAEDTEHEVQVRATNDEGTSGWSDPGSASTHKVNGGAAATAPTVTDVAVTSTPASGTTYYLAGEVIEFTVTFSAPVTVTATPKFAFRLGAATRQAAYASGSESAALVFARTVQAGEVDRNGISWNSLALALDGGTITQTGATTAASLTHAEQAPLEGHRVDAAPPMQVSASVHGMSLVLVYDEPLDPASMPATGAYTVTATVGATTTNPAVSEVSIYGIWVTLALDAAPAAGATVTLAYAPPASNPVQDEAGNDAPAFSGQSVRLGPPPPPVTNLAQVMGVGVVPGNAQLVVTWTAVSTATGYTVQWTSSGQGYNIGDRQATVTSGSTTRYTIPSLTNGTEYTGRVIATRTGADDGPPSAEVTGTPFTTPGAPQHLSGVPGDEQVMLTWDAPSSDGGSAILRYEYAIDDSGTWIDAGLDLEETVPGLTNGQQYAFEVRAVNSAGPGAPATTAATPLGMPSVPESLTATGGDGEVVLEWTEPADDGGTPVTGYEYRFAAGTAVPEDTPWQSAGLDLEWTVTGLTNGQQYAFEVRARNRVGPGETSGTTALPLRLRAELFSSAVAEGEALVVGVRRSGRLTFPAHAYIGVTDSALPGVTATEEGRDDGLGRHRLEFAAGAAEATVTVTVAFDGERRQDRVLTATLDSAELEVDGVRRPYELVTPTLVVPVTEGDAGLSVADARVQGKSSVLAFTVSMDRTRDVAVRVDYATEDGSARAGEDYTPVSGTLTIEAGGRERTVEVPVLPALHVTGERTLVLRLSNAVSAVIDDGVATGVIVRESELPKAWLARFGRTASDHAAQAIARRLEAGQRETQVTVAGRRVDGLLVDGLLSGALPSGGWRPASAVEDMATRLAAPALAASRAPFGGVDADPGTPGLRAGTWGGAPGALDRESSADAGQTLRRAVLPDFGYRLPGAEEALMGTSFYVERGAQQDVGGGTWAAWGDVAATRFEGDAGGLALNGDVVTGTAGLDRQWRAVLVGLGPWRTRDHAGERGRARGGPEELDGGGGCPGGAHGCRWARDRAAFRLPLDGDVLGRDRRAGGGGGHGEPRAADARGRGPDQRARRRRASQGRGRCALRRRGRGDRTGIRGGRRTRLGPGIADAPGQREDAHRPR